MSPLLLDTCALLWLAAGDARGSAARAVMQKAHEAGGEAAVSPISAWEIGLLSARGRIALTEAPRRWFARVVALPGVMLAAMPPEVLIAASDLPGVLHRDPADRILVATAREYGYRLLTGDRLLLDYADQGHVMAVPC
jgi:PIN domain nuclease of toxin-antitoxin system